MPNKPDYSKNTEGRRAIFPASIIAEFPEHWRIINRFNDPRLDIELLIVEGDSRFPEWIRGETYPFTFTSMEAFTRHYRQVPNNLEPDDIVSENLKYEWQDND